MLPGLVELGAMGGSLVMGTLLGLSEEQGDQDDDRDRHAEKEKQKRSHVWVSLVGMKRGSEVAMTTAVGRRKARGKRADEQRDE